MLVTSRAAAEYRAMFDLGPGDVTGTVLDCCAGGSSFAAETAATGGFVIAVDPAYACGDLEARVDAGLRNGGQIINEHADRFEWSWYGEPGRRAELRRDAAARFLADLRRRPGRYVAGALPNLPLATGAFDLVLCSHLLFTWSDRFGVDWHRRALAELIRVTRGEVRVYPLVVQATGAPVPFLDTLRREVHAMGHRSEVRAVPYRFQRGADRMLVVDGEPAAGFARR